MIYNVENVIILKLRIVINMEEENVSVFDEYSFIINDEGLI
jgi:hypothetical protein